MTVGRDVPAGTAAVFKHQHLNKAGDDPFGVWTDIEDGAGGGCR